MRKNKKKSVLVDASQRSEGAQREKKTSEEVHDEDDIGVVVSLARTYCRSSSRTSQLPFAVGITITICCFYYHRSIKIIRGSAQRTAPRNKGYYNDAMKFANPVHGDVKNHDDDDATRCPPKAPHTPPSETIRTPKRSRHSCTFSSGNVIPGIVRCDTAGAKHRGK